jgi:signal transduction histidine kinase/CheY-like chemotaxis protein
VLKLSNTVTSATEIWADLRQRSKRAQEPAIAHELFRLGYRNLWVHLIGQICLSSIVGAASYGVASTTVSALWMIWMGMSVLVIAAGLIGFRQATHSVPLGNEYASTKFVQLISKWRLGHLVIVCLVGIGWGSVGLLLKAGQEQHNIMLFISFAGTLAYSSASNGPHDIRGFVISAIIAFCILASQLPRTLGESSAAVIGMTTLYFLVLTMTAFSARLTLIDSIALRLKNEELAQKNAENAARAEQANRDRSEFFAAASHDLRQPVHALMLLLEAYQRQEPQAASHPLVQSIHASGKSIGDLFNAIMEISRLESSVERPKPALFDVTEVMAEVFERLRPEAQSKGLSFRMVIAKNLPRRTLLSDRFMLERVLSNLLVNAVRYTHSGSVLLCLRLAPKARADAPPGMNGLRIEVWDSGIGIAQKDQARIYEPYVQLGNQHRDRSKGLGLGLSIVRRIVDLLGMELTLRSTPNRGSRFSIHVPAIVCKVDRMLRSPSNTLANINNADALVAGQVLSGLRVLLIDDDTMVQNAMRALLNSWGAEVRVIGSVDALDEACDNNAWMPDSVLSDFRLPGQLNGLTVLKIVQTRFPRCRCVLQTGELAQLVELQAKQANIPVLFKPVTPSMLLDAIQKSVDPDSAGSTQVQKF